MKTGGIAVVGAVVVATPAPQTVPLLAPVPRFAEPAASGEFLAQAMSGEGSHPAIPA